MSMSIKQRFNLLLKKTEEQTPTFDQGDFNLKIFGGPTQADLIRVEADLINPQKFGNKSISLNCKWFNKTQKDLIQIPGTAGQGHYQPSLKDIGTIIRIQCFPEIQGKSYEGMPIIRDIGPLIIYKQTEEDAQEFVESGSATLLVRVTKTHKSTHYSETDGLVKVTEDEISIKTKQGDDFVLLMSGELSERFPSYEADTKNHKLLRVLFSQDEFVEVLVQQSRMRDVIVLASKMLAGKRIMALKEKQQEQEQEEYQNEQQKIQQTPTPSLTLSINTTQLSSPLKKNFSQQSPTRKHPPPNPKDLLQLADLTKQCSQLTLLTTSLQKQLSESHLLQLESTTKFKTSQQRLQNLNKNYFLLEKQLKEIKSKNSSDDDKFVFVNNEVRVLKEENEGLKRKLAEVSGNLGEAKLELKNYLSQQEGVGNKMTYEVLHQEYIRYKNQSQILAKRLTYTQSQTTKFSQELILQKQKNQELSYDLHRLNNKYQLLLRENKLPSKSQQSQLLIQQKGREEEIIRLKLQIKNLVDENDDLRKRVVVKSPEKLESKNPKKAQLKELQKLANRLSEAITEKDLIIANMREVNKELVGKVKEYGDKEREEQENKREEKGRSEGARK